MPDLYNNRLVIIVLLVSVLNINTVVAAESGLSFSVRLFGEGYDDHDRASGGAWEGKNKFSGTEFESTDGTQLAFSGAYQYGDFYTGLNIQLGEKFSFDGNAPAQINLTGTTEVANDRIERKELDIIFGYYLNEYFSLFVDLKGISNTWESNHYRQDFVGLGFGATGILPIGKSWTLYASSGFIPTGDVEANDQKVGDGKGIALDIGAMYAINPNHRLMIGLKESYYVYKFDTGDEQTHRMDAAYIGYSYAFSLD